MNSSARLKGLGASHVGTRGTAPHPSSVPRSRDRRGTGADLKKPPFRRYSAEASPANTRKAELKTAITGQNILIIFYSTHTTRRWLLGSLTCLAMLVIYTNLAIAPLNQQIEGWETNALLTDCKI